MKQLILIISLTLVAFSACKKSKKQVPLPNPVLNEPELITTLILKFQDSIAANPVLTYVFRDADGPGGAAPSAHDSIILSTGSVYTVSVILLDETRQPADTVSKEIWNERDEHQLFYHHQGVQINTTYLDSDNSGRPVGLTTRWRSGSAGNGTSRVVMKHQTDGKTGNEQSGETDIEVIFKTRIK